MYLGYVFEEMSLQMNKMFYFAQKSCRTHYEAHLLNER